MKTTLVAWLKLASLLFWLVICALLGIWLASWLVGCSPATGNSLATSESTVSRNLVPGMDPISLYDVKHRGHDYLVARMNGVSMIHAASCPCQTNAANITTRTIFLER